MCRNEKIDGSCCHRRGDAAMGERLPDRARDVGIGYEFSERERRDGGPNLRLKRSACEREREIEAPEPPGEIGADLCGGFGEQSVARLAPRRPGAGHERTADDRSIVAYDHQIATNGRRNT
ncbi:MAG TPA: hypothetical protein VGG70_12540 [Candidatus Cybelea sp.]|jgi:hypothetical protein